MIHRCDRCGRAMPRYVERPWKRRAWERRVAKRWDARYCSNACRQAAYRERKEEDLIRRLLGQ